MALGAPVLDRADPGRSDGRHGRAVALVRRREVEYGPQVGTASLPAPALPQWVVWDITDLVGDWAAGGLENDGILLELVDGQEDYGTSGPLFPSSSYPNVSLRPRLTVWYVA